MKKIDHLSVKHGFATHVVPFEVMYGINKLTAKPSIGDVILAEVLKTGQHSKIEDRNGAVLNLFEGDLIIGVFGNRYATDQFEGYVPKSVVEECDMLSIGGVLGEVASKHAAMSTPTRVKILGVVCDRQGSPVSSVAHGLKPSKKVSADRKSEIVLVVGASMNSGKTTTCGIIARSLANVGFKVGAAKMTGTAASKDGRFFQSCGAREVLDFTDAGYPATYLLSLTELIEVYQSLVGKLEQSNPDFIVIEIADGIFQRETKMLLESKEFMKDINHVFFAANDSLSAECGVRHLKSLGVPLRAVSGMMTQGHLNIVEAESATGVPCLSMEMILAGRALELMRQKQKVPSAKTLRLPRLEFRAA